MNNINLKNKNSSLFTNFVKNVVHNPSPEVQKNFMDISLKIAETIRKICEEEKLIFEVPNIDTPLNLVPDTIESIFVVIVAVSALSDAISVVESNVLLL